MQSTKKCNVSLAQSTECFLRAEAQRLGLSFEETVLIFFKRGVTRLSDKKQTKHSEKFVAAKRRHAPF